MQAAIAVHKTPNAPNIGIATNKPIRQNTIPTTKPNFDWPFPGLTCIFFDIFLYSPLCMACRRPEYILLLIIRFDYISILQYELSIIKINFMHYNISKRANKSFPLIPYENIILGNFLSYVPLNKFPNNRHIH